MALKKCGECGGQISSSAKKCPHCGKKKTGILSWLLLGFIFFIVYSSCSSYEKYKKLASDKSQQLPSLVDQQQRESTVEQQTEAPAWEYSQEEDKMGPGKNYYAQILSKNTVEFDFPYAGEQNGTLLIRKHARYGKDVMFSIRSGQILCTSYDGCDVSVRFDNDKPVKFHANSPDDNSTEHVFIENTGLFIKKMRSSKIVRISPTIYQEGSPVFEFNVAGFDELKFHGK